MCQRNATGRKERPGELALRALSLDLCAQGRQVVAHYDGRRHDYAFGGYTYYYSRPRMIAVGELRRGGERVEGELWFDRQYGALSSAMLEGELLLREGVDLECPWSTWPGVGERVLERGRDFDDLIFGISLGAVESLCPTLLAQAPAWRRMVDHVKTVATQAVQLWMEPTLEQLGWRHPSPVLDAYDDPFNTWADMSCLLKREDWRGPTRPGSLAYLVGPLHEHAAPPPPGPAAAGFQQRQVEAVKARALRWLDRAAPGIWPATSRGRATACSSPAAASRASTRSGTGSIPASTPATSTPRRSPAYRQRAPSSAVHARSPARATAGTATASTAT